MAISRDAITKALEAAGLLVEVRGAVPAAFSGVTDDSRTVAPGSLFIAVKGSERDGHAFLAGAAGAGAIAAMVENASATSLPAIVVRDGRRAAAAAAAAAYNWPTRSLQIVGVTGTNGKTTTVNMLRHLLDEPQRRAASIGTLGVLLGSEGLPVPGGAGLTTPGPVELQRVLRTLVDQGVGRVAMEVSSHSLDQRRVDGLAFDVVAFTNLTRDHLDYHGTMERYFEAKAKLLEYVAAGGVVVVNADDPTWEKLVVRQRRLTFSERDSRAPVHARDIRFGPRGSEWSLVIDGRPQPVRLPLIGDFNVANGLAAAACGYALGFDPALIARRLGTMPQVPGRLEVLRESPTVLRDYSHTPDALDRALEAVRAFTPGRLIVVFGAGGDRDKGKRPEMGRIAESKADYAIVTSDNPRTEDPVKILADIEAGMHAHNHQKIEDRRAAIARAIVMAGPRDVVVLAGKGHETYQVRGTTKYPFDEKVIVAELAAERASAGVAFWTRDRVADALAGLAAVNLPRGTQTFQRVWTDTRTIAPGDLFVALTGERFDAHDFLRDAVQQGAAGVVVSRVEATKGLGVPVYQVSDTLEALGALANYRRRAWASIGPVIAVVGTNGKTSTKELIRAALDSRLEVHATTGNLNNLVGVPLTLLAIPDSADAAVIEMGTNVPGEIERLRRIVQPDITVVTSIGEEHLEGLGDLAGVLREEMAACKGVPVAIVPASQPEVVDASRKTARRVVAVGLDTGEVRPASWSIGRDGTGLATMDDVAVTVPLRGAHNLRNAMLAFAVARELGISTADAARGIARMTPPPMRSNWVQIGRATLINDAYNANPPSTRAAIELLAHAGGGRQRVAVLGTMLELGPHTPTLHEELARQALASGIEVIGAIGEFAGALQRIAPDDQRVVVAQDTDVLWSKLAPRLDAEAIILLKGSRGMRLERLVGPITEWAESSSAVTR